MSAENNEMYALHRMAFGLIYDMMEHGVVLYGYGKTGRRAKKILHALDIRIRNIYDENADTLSFFEKNVLPPEKIPAQEDHDAVCLVASLQDKSSIIRKLREYYPNIFGCDLLFQIVRGLPARYGEHGFTYHQAKPFDFLESLFVSPLEERFVKQERIEHLDSEQIAWNLETQSEYCRYFMRIYPEYLEDAKQFRRFDAENLWFYGMDALVYYGILRRHLPKRIIEIGSGCSTHFAMDVSELHLGGDVKITCIDPKTERLLKKLDIYPYEKLQIFPMMVQDVPLSLFAELKAGDILFIDSSHVVKAGGDVAFEIFHILPRLASGVLIHFHDIFYPFCYPTKWIKLGMPYTEAYVLHAFLSYNDAYEMLFFEDMMVHHQEISKGTAFRNILGTWNKGSLWLRKI